MHTGVWPCHAPLLSQWTPFKETAEFRRCSALCSSRFEYCDGFRLCSTLFLLGFAPCAGFRLRSTLFSLGFELWATSKCLPILTSSHLPDILSWRDAANKDMIKSWNAIAPYVLIAPQTLIFLLFLIFPIATIVVVSFWEFTGYSMTPAFTLDNYIGIFTSQVTLGTYLSTFRFVGLVWLFTLLIGFPVSYFLAFCIEDVRLQIILFLVCTVPFWTSNIIRMISWIPFLGREGILNNLLISIGVTDSPIDIFLFSDFAVVLAMVHLYTLFMIVPIFNSLMRIERSLIAAAQDAGASSLQVLKEVIVPLAFPGIAIGSIFVVTLTMGEFVTIRLMSGGQSASIGYLIRNQIGSLQYPLAAANAVILLMVTLVLIFAIMRLVDIRKEL